MVIWCGDNTEHKLNFFFIHNLDAMILKPAYSIH